MPGFLIQAGGLNILTDPQFSERASPVSFGGPETARASRCGDQGPAEDRCSDSQPQSLRIILNSDTVKALGNAPGILSARIQTVAEKARHHERAGTGLVGTAGLRGLCGSRVPASILRTVRSSDRNEALWAGWVIETRVGKIFFSGDTDMRPLFAEIGKRLAHAAFLYPIGGYSPRWFMKAMHVEPARGCPHPSGCWGPTVRWHALRPPSSSPMSHCPAAGLSQQALKEAASVRAVRRNEDRRDPCVPVVVSWHQRSSSCVHAGRDDRMADSRATVAPEISVDGLTIRCGAQAGSSDEARHGYDGRFISRRRAGKDALNGRSETARAPLPYPPQGRKCGESSGALPQENVAAPGELAGLRPEIEQLKRLYRHVKVGTGIALDYAPQEALRFSSERSPLGTIEGGFRWLPITPSARGKAHQRIRSG